MATAMTLYWWNLDSGTLAPTYYGQLDATVRELCTENAVTPPTAPWESQLACSLVSTWLTQIDRAVRAVATIVDVPAPATTLTHLDAGQFEAVYWHQLDSCVREIINPTENTVAPAVTPDPAAPGDLLTTTNGTWTGGSGTPAYTYQWWVDGAAVSGAMAQTYQTTEAQDGSDVYCVVTNTNATGQVSADSNTVTLASYEGPLDLVPGAVAAYGVRALSAAMIGEDIIRLRRASDDAELDFAAGVDGSVDAAAIATWAGGDAFIVTLYDQSGNGKDATNATTTQQPLWAANVQNNRPAGLFSKPARQRLNTADRVDIANGETSVFAVFNSTGVVGNLFLTGANIQEEVEDPYWEVRIGWTEETETVTYRVEQWSNPNNAGSNVSNIEGLEIIAGLHLFESAWKFGAGAATMDGIALSYTGNLDSGELVGQIDQRMSVGYGDAAAFPSNSWDGHIAEEIVYASIVSAPNRAVLRQNIADYYGITLS